MIFYTLHGAVYDRWRIRPPEAAGLQTWDVPLAPLSGDDFSESLSPLHRWRDKLTVIDGLSLATALDERRRDVNAHTLGHVHSLSARSTLRSSRFSPFINSRASSTSNERPAT